ncbi:hypothetical protein JMN32_22265 [Fulvivirga sp. 29W222]|uniref:Hsp20/alpha crystallin family protein n=1 Tax=Fulvivirga marina TaxID=2494733 RepID=A0A937G218_9BACT|nr:Hsp20 family protein [Fulvivirga marina]MBL6449053.1 hypothetical protein [Fulvivirga marina]
MKYDKDKKWVRRVLHTADIVNTLNGGISEPQVELEKKSDHYLLKARIPGVDIEKIKVEIVEKNLMVYHNLEFKGRNNSVIMVPHVAATCPLSPEIDFRNISASFEEKILSVFLPFNELRTGFHKNIEIKKW